MSIVINILIHQIHLSRRKFKAKCTFVQSVLDKATGFQVLTMSSIVLLDDMLFEDHSGANRLGRSKLRYLCCKLVSGFCL